MGVQVIKGDITKMKVDAIVNAANTSLLGGGGVDGAIHRAAGHQLLEECRTLNGCNTGEAKMTGGYNLPAKHVIHTPGPIWRGGDHNESSLLDNSYKNSLKLADEAGLKTVAFPSISTGIYSFPLEKAAVIAINAITEFLKTATNVVEVTMVCFDDRTKEAYEKALNNKAR